MSIEKFSDLLGHTLTDVSRQKAKWDRDELIFTLSTGERYKLYHSKHCCEDVHIADINGELADLVGSPLLQCEESSSDESVSSDEDVYATWTFYKMATRNGYVTIRWLGESNGYYSQAVDFSRVG